MTCRSRTYWHILHPNSVHAPHTYSPRLFSARDRVHTSACCATTGSDRRSTGYSSCSASDDPIDNNIPSGHTRKPSSSARAPLDQKWYTGSKPPRQKPRLLLLSSYLPDSRLLA